MQHGQSPALPAAAICFPNRDTEIKSETDRRVTSPTPSTGVTLFQTLTDFDVTHFRETLVLYPVDHMIVPYTRVYRHPLGQSCDRSTCHEPHTHTHTHSQSVSLCMCAKRRGVQSSQ